MSTEIQPLDRSDFLPMGTGLPDVQADAETPRWCFSFLTIDTRDQEIGRPTIKSGTPTLIRRWPYVRRNDDLGLGETQAPPMHTQDYNYPGPYLSSALVQYAPWGLVELDMLKGMDTRQDIDWVIALTTRVLPHPLLFDNAEDPHQDLFKRRAAWLEARRKEFKVGSKEERFCAKLIEANAQTQKYMNGFFASFFDDVMKAKNPGFAQQGRTSLQEGEDLMLKWCGLKPSKFFDGYDEPTAPVGPAQLNIPPEMLAFFTAVTATKDEENEKLKATIAVMAEQMAAINATVQAQAAEKKASGKPPQTP